MKRFLVFTLLGPLLGFAILAAVGVYANGRPIPPLIRGIPFAYFLGLLPALLAAIADWKLASFLKIWPRIGLMFFVGYLVTFLAWLLIFSRGHSLREALAFGAFGAISAAVCSGLSATRSIHA
jgi:hypothetical protein